MAQLQKQSPTSLSRTANEDSFVKLIGDFGIWQLFVFITMTFARISTAWAQLAILFLTPNLTFRCVELTSSRNVTAVVASNSTCYDTCVRYEYDTTPFKTTIVSEWGLVCDRKWLASFTQTVLQFGILVGSVPFGFLSDKYGRKKTFLGAMTMLIGFGLGVPFSPNYIVFTTLRFFVGLSTGGVMIVAFVILMEWTGPKHREGLGCYYQLGWVTGELTISLAAYYLRRWDTYSLSLAAPTLIYLSYFFLLSESPRWLVSVGRVQEAATLLEKAAKFNKLPTADIKATVTKLADEAQAHNREKPAHWVLFERPLRLKTACITTMWLVGGVGYYGFNQYAGQASADPFLSVALAAAIQIPANIATVFLARHFGRRKTCVTFFILSGLCFIILGFVPNGFWTNLTLTTTGISFVTIVCNVLYIYCLELFPTVIRNTALGLCSSSMRVGSMAAPFIVNWSSTTPWLTIVMFGIFPVVAGFVALLLPETKGKILPDSIEDIDRR